MKNVLKLLIVAMLALCLVFALASCGDDEENNQENTWQDTNPTDNGSTGGGGGGEDEGGEGGGLTNDGVAPGDGYGNIVFG